MTTPFDVGSRVVCPDPTGRRFVGVVQRTFDLSFREDGEDPRVRVVVSDGALTMCVGVEEVRPVMPRGPEDLDKYGRWWWCEDFVVAVMVMLSPPGIAMFWPASDKPDEVYAHEGWRGPVQPPPVVRV